LTGFPWVQLVFCLVCLGMASFLCIAHSFAWSYRADGARDFPGKGAYAEVVGVVIGAQETADGHLLIVDAKPSEDRGGSDWKGPVTCLVPKGVSDSLPIGTRAVLRGRRVDGVWARFHIDTSASRFVPESVAGLVVGAMGVFIFGLYLRAWLRGRKALAGELPQDMIA
jgi:hypothetical protein